MGTRQLNTSAEARTRRMGALVEVYKETSPIKRLLLE